MVQPILDTDSGRKPLDLLLQPFLPTDIPDCVLWLDGADEAGTITKDGSNRVSNWADKSGHAHHGTQGTDANKPISGIRTINSLNVLDFQSNDKISLPSALYTLPLGNNTVFIVAGTDNTAAATQTLLSGTNSGSTRYRIMYLNSSGNQYEIVNGTVSNPASYTYNTAPHIHTMLRSNAAIIGTIDGATIVNAATANANAINAFAIGTQANNTSGGWDGPVGEVVIYNRALSQAEGGVVMAYLSAKWGIAASAVSWPDMAIAGFGDSITAGSGASPSSNRWLSQLASGLNATTSNQGISGTVLQNSLSLTNNGRDRYVAALTGASRQDRIYILYGLNDLRYTASPGSMNLANFVNDYMEVLTGLLSAGYSADAIYIGSPPYITAAGYSVGDPDFTGANTTIHEQYVAAVQDIAESFGVWYAPVYENMKAYGDGCVSGDNIHPNNTGHGIIATAFSTYAVKL